MHHRSHDWGGLPPGGSASGQGWSASRREGVCFQGRGVCIREGGWADLSPLRDTWDTTECGQQAGDTHPTGMHSCIIYFYNSSMSVFITMFVANKPEVTVVSDTLFLGTKNLLGIPYKEDWLCYRFSLNVSTKTQKKFHRQFILQFELF